jgi:hypothetical protein
MLVAILFPVMVSVVSITGGILILVHLSEG